MFALSASWVSNLMETENAEKSNARETLSSTDLSVDASLVSSLTRLTEVNVWVVDSSANLVSRLPTASNVTRVSTPTAEHVRLASQTARNVTLQLHANRVKKVSPILRPARKGMRLMETIR